ncbi:LPD29 domain-containing protein [Streptacidiphilus cavernicola]|uniref:LPD29 domain-containing protein n=1 Tax=Streptacidiphilus cavernicola TaxID=3342716 RepID=A0ABV6VY65_9ACTN
MATSNLTTAQVNRHIRQTLAAAFPGTEFTVSARRGDFPLVAWTDGPSTTQVREITDALKQAETLTLATVGGPRTGPNPLEGVNLRHDASPASLAEAEGWWRVRHGDADPADYADSFRTPQGHYVRADFGTSQILALAYDVVMPARCPGGEQ